MRRRGRGEPPAFAARERLLRAQEAKAIGVPVMIEPTGRELKDLGIPPDRIKYFVGKEYASRDDLLEAIRSFKKTPAKSDDEREIERIIRADPDCAFQVLWELQVFPWSTQSRSTSPSKREVRQWLDQGAVRINGKFPKAHEHVEFPITDLVYFPGAKRQTTIV